MPLFGYPFPMRTSYVHVPEHIIRKTTATAIAYPLGPLCQHSLVFAHLPTINIPLPSKWANFKAMVKV